jgi:hypothetical protein
LNVIKASFFTHEVIFLRLVNFTVACNRLGSPYLMIGFMAVWRYKFIEIKAAQLMDHRRGCSFRGGGAGVCFEFPYLRGIGREGLDCLNFWGFVSRRDL